MVFTMKRDTAAGRRWPVEEVSCWRKIRTMLAVAWTQTKSCSMI